MHTSNPPYVDRESNLLCPCCLPALQFDSGMSCPADTGYRPILREVTADPPNPAVKFSELNGLGWSVTSRPALADNKNASTYTSLPDFYSVMVSSMRDCHGLTVVLVGAAEEKRLRTMCPGLQHGTFASAVCQCQVTWHALGWPCQFKPAPLRSLLTSSKQTASDMTASCD
jgi:hypothetical protein